MKGRWKAGQSGNPRGRPRGLPDVRARWRNEIAEHVPAIIKRLAAAAEAGDVQAAGLLLARCVPPARPESAPVAFTLPSGAGLADAGRAVLDAAAEGRMAPDIAAQLVGALAGLARVVEVEELAARIERLESVQRGQDDE